MKSAILIPSYNHAAGLEQVLRNLLPLNFTVLVVDDASTDSTVQLLSRLVEKHSNLTFNRHSYNSGKGAAIATGLLKLQQLGYTHALTIDADGQHDLSDIDSFIRTATKNPAAVILGEPIFDEDIPLARLYGREISNLLIKIEAWNFTLRDVLCGYRLYPIAACLPYISTNKCRRMDFDPDIIVYLARQNIEMIYLPTKVNYPSDGISHFKYCSDNIKIARAHLTRLLTLIPYLLSKLLHG